VENLHFRIRSALLSNRTLRPFLIGLNCPTCLLIAPMLYNFIKIIEGLFMPLGFLWVLIFLVSIYQFRRKSWLGGSVGLLLVIALWLLGATPLCDHLIASLERPYAKQDLKSIPEADAIIMLGGSVGPSPRDILNLNLGFAGVRSITAMELARLGKGKNLVFGGGAFPQDNHTILESELLANWYKKWDVSATPVISLEACLNTRDEAQKVLSLQKEHGWQSLILVTSAFHMRRAEAVFRKAQLKVQPAACNFIGLSSLQYGAPFKLTPDPQRLHLLALYAHEQIGYVYYKLRKWI
jgi:uncharacterized SAM-binding protein YcdF (DUF218 family)